MEWSYLSLRQNFASIFVIMFLLVEHKIKYYDTKVDLLKTCFQDSCRKNKRGSKISPCAFLQGIFQNEGLKKHGE